MLDSTLIPSPKRSKKYRTDWEGFFPYYAGFPENFAHEIISKIGLPPNAVIYDPWNGSGTTTYAASMLGNASIGFDINPAMIIIAKARLLPPSEADSLLPIGLEIAEKASKLEALASDDDPLRIWFGKGNAAALPDDAKLHLAAREREFIEDYERAMEMKVGLPDDVIDMESNLSSVVLMKNLYKLGLSYSPVEGQNAKINKLLGIRNAIAHGDTLKKPNKEEVDEYVASAFGVMGFVQNEIYRALNSKVYLRENKKA